MRYLLATALVLLFAPVAHAGHWTNTDVQTALRVADNHWPNSPCHGHALIEWPATLPGGNAGDAILDGGCTIQIAWKTVIAGMPTPDYLCDVLEHEYGHIAGYAHTTIPGDVMNPDHNNVSYDCAKAFPARSMCRYVRGGRNGMTLRAAVFDACLPR